MARDYNRRDFLKGVLVAGSLFGLAGRVFGGELANLEDALIVSKDHWVKSLKMGRKVVDAHNKYRRKAKLPLLEHDKGLSVGCVNHSKYLVVNMTPGTNKDMHSEDDFMTCRTLQGRLAGKSGAATLAYNYMNKGPITSVDGWWNLLLHRYSMMHPDARKAGFGYYEKNEGKDPYWAAVMSFDINYEDYKLTEEVMEARKTVRIVKYPLNGQRDLPRAMELNEIPNPIPEQDKDQRVGCPITVFYYNDALEKGVPRNVKASLKDGRLDVPFWLSTPDDPLPNTKGFNMIGILPKDILNPNTKYTVDLEAVVDGEKWSDKWSFRTGNKYTAELPLKPKGEP